ncbi:MAG: ADP-ribosylglycohydrolase family protein [Aquificae bacterium]|nr:ADP-ribosylglycohydrolase family protein [Aquificota bacterium]
MNDELLSKFEGTVVGAALGAALGKAVHFVPKEEVERFFGKPITDFTRPHPSSPYDFLLPEEVPGEVELLRLALESLVERKTFDPYDFVERVVRWLSEAKVHKYLNPSLLNALRALALGEDLEEVYRRTASIDAVLHTVVMGLYHYDDPTLAAQGARVLALVLVRGREVDEAAQVIGAATALLVEGEFDLGDEGERERFIDEVVEVCPELVEAPKYLAKVKEALKKNLRPKEAVELFGNGEFVWEALPLALFLFLRDASYPQRAFLNAVNAYGEAGGATAALGFLVGAWVGAYWGIEVFPPEWVEKVEHSKRLRELAQKLYELVVLNR